MNKISKPIRLSKHAKEQLPRRGSNEDEVIKAIKSCKWSPTELGRMECRMSLEFNNIWNKKYYKIKEVRPIFVEEKNEIVVITVYVYYS